ncbi:hypothetical protein CFE70_007118 [Pyrenophora teres f. teres 0-1]|uniref:Mur ligase central domain-containing protein n=1 Tax=Pyrenophora teres f. teres (strain 0-1) TaxID=861557 RepID=E3RQV8_PYRTT|nr:hypothetical protein PTT_11148 [Pyrenophora teres f. teres 0-1]KAE8856673.1 hypothetical protein PTNB73_09395 [Pyrenophora teres f. teres]
MARIQPGLERISQLLRGVQFPWQSIHVAGTNGKGTICHYVSSLISKKRSRVKSGAFTSPHLIDRWDCISINNTPVDESVFRKIEQHYLDLNLREGINASPFEILTATAFTIFNEESVGLAVVEVGMGGKLDATNILNNQAVCVIAKIARDHEGFLGNTLNEIALHKAGILRKNVPYIINPQNEGNVKRVITEYGDQIGAIQTDLTMLPRSFYTRRCWQRMSSQMRPMQQLNPLLATVATVTAYQSLNLRFTPTALNEDLYNISKAVNPGRLEVAKVPPVFGDPNGKNNTLVKGRRILVDGAHNPDAAKLLADHVNSNQRKVKRGKKGENTIKPPRNGWPVMWVLAMTEGKDAEQYLSILLQPGDSVITTTFGPVDGMPWVKPMDPKKLLKIAQSVHPSITGMAMPRDGVLRALCAAKFLADPKGPIVLTGSLYLVGDFHRELRPRRAQDYMRAPEYEDDRKMFKAMLQTEEKRVRALFGNPYSQPSYSGVSTHDSTFEEESVDSATSLDFEQVHVESEQQDQRQLERERWSNMQAELATIDDTLDAIAEEELSVLKKWAPQNDDTKSVQKEEAKKGEEGNKKNIVEKREMGEEGGEHGKEQNGSNDIEETDERDILTTQNEQSKQAESVHSPEMLDEKKPSTTLTTYKGDGEPVTKHEGLTDRPKVGNEPKIEPNQETANEGLKEDTGYEIRMERSKFKGDGSRDALSSLFEEETGVTIRKHTGYIKKTFPNFRDRFGDKTYSR